MYITNRAFYATLAGIPIAAVAETVVAAWVWLGLIAIVVMADVVAAPSTRSVAVRRTPPSSLRLSTSGDSITTLLNLSGRRIRGVLRDAWQPSAGAENTRHPFNLASQEAERFATTLTPTRRGERDAGPITLRLLGPLRFAGRQLSVPAPGRVRVLPEFSSRKHLPSKLAQLRELDGRSAVQIRGAGSEFDSLREYVIGDDVRSIDWRATARRNDVVVRTWRPERDRHVVILLDTGRTSAARIGNAPRLDASIEATLLLAALANEAGDRVQVIAYGRQARARLSGLSGASMIAGIADRLAPVDPQLIETDWVGAVQEILHSTSQRALVVLLTTIDPAIAEAGLLSAIAPLAFRHQLMVASVSDPEHHVIMEGREDVLALFNAAAANRVELEREATAVRLRSHHVEVVSAGPDELAPAVADKYLALKAAGRL